MAKAKSEEEKVEAAEADDQNIAPVSAPEPETKAAKKSESYRVKNPLMAHNSVYAVTGARIEFDGGGVSGELDVRDFNQLTKLSGYQRA